MSQQPTSTPPSTPPGAGGPDAGPGFAGPRASGAPGTGAGGTSAGYGGRWDGRGGPAVPVGRDGVPGRWDGRRAGGAGGAGGGGADGERARVALNRLRAEVGKAVVGQDAAVTGLVIALLCRGHVLLEGVPGVAKTLLVRALSAALALETKRVQFTPDLMPGDVTGSLVYDARTAEFSFRAGPVFTNLLLADEINRTPPKTQASLLEAMEERQVTVDGEPRPLPDPFLVVATQNPIEYEGTYPLPEAQLDRFLLKLTVPLPSRDEEFGVLQRPPPRLRPARPAGRRGRPRSRTRPTSPPAAPRSRGVQARRGGARVRRGPVPGHPAVAVAVAGRLPPGRDRAAGHGQGVGLAVRPRTTSPRTT